MGIRHMGPDDRPPLNPFPMKLGKTGRRSVRLDRPPASKSEAGAAALSVAKPEKAWALELIRQAIGGQPRAQERRESIRHPAVDASVWAGWWEGDEFGVTEGKLIDLSRGGALVVLGERPPGRDPVWFYKESGEALATVRGYVVRTTVAPEGAFAVRFRFVTQCPTFFFQAALCRQPPGKSGRPRIVPPV